MKEYLKTLIQSSSSPVEAGNWSREYLQALILQSLQRTGAMTTIAFHGGTALRFLYSLPLILKTLILLSKEILSCMISVHTFKPFEKTWKHRAIKLRLR